MKKIRISALLIVLCMMMLAFTSCLKPEVAMEYKGVTMSGNLYSYWMSYFKTGSVSSSDDNDAFWNKKDESGKTNEEILREIVDIDFKYSLICQKLFDDLGLMLSDADNAEIDSYVNDIILAWGSEEALNEELYKYDIDSKMLRELFVIKKKNTAVYETLYAANGPRAIKSDSEVLEKFYKENYYRLDMIQIYVSYEYELNDKGEMVFDNDAQSYKTKTLTEAEQNEKKALAQDIMKKLNNGEKFDDLKEKYNENIMKEQFADGYYMSSNDVAVYGRQLYTTARDLKIGECKMIAEDDMICIVMKKELREKAYKDQNYAEQFENILEYCKKNDFLEYINGMMGDVVVHEDVIKKYNLRDAQFITDRSLIVL